MRQEINYDQLHAFVTAIQSKLKNCPFCGHPAHLEDNVGSWDNNPEFEITCSNYDCFLHNISLTTYDIEEWEELNLETMTGLKKILSKMKKVWNHRVSSAKGETK